MNLPSSSTLSRYTRPVDGTIPIPALLYDDEELIASQDAVGLYDGASKSMPHQSGTVHITSHRLFFISSSTAPSGTTFQDEVDDGTSLALDLSHVVHTESYGGFFKSSPKVTLYLAPLNDVAGPSRLSVPSPAPVRANVQGTVSTNDAARSQTLSPSNFDDDDWSSWECTICGNRNPPGLSPAARSVCTLCGMPRDLTTLTSGRTTLRPSSPISVPQPQTSTPSHAHSRSLPSSGQHTPLVLTNNETDYNENEIPCTACTFLNHPSLRECEMCGTPLNLPATSSSSSSRPQSQHLSPQPSKSAPVSRPSSPESSERENGKSGNKYIRLSFRKGGDKAFYASLKTSLQVKGWVGRGNNKWRNSDGDSTPVLTGIGGLLQNVESNAKTAEQGLSSAFSDLEALMQRAQDMVRLANDLNEQLAASSRKGDANSTDQEPEEVAFVRSSLAKLGLTIKNAPVTSDMTTDEKEYAQKLARELAEVLQGDRAPGGEDDVEFDALGGQSGKQMHGLMKQRGIVGLDEVWGGWNRVRGIALIPPDTAIKTLTFLPHYTSPPITHRKLASGLLVLHTPPYSTEAFGARLLGRIEAQGPCTTLDVSQAEGLTIGFAGELINEAENLGDIMRDDASSGLRGGAGSGISSEVRWWSTATLKGYVWDGQIN